MNGRPWFRFFASDWLASTSIALMTPEQEGGYIRLLAHAWNDPDCSLPDDDAALATLSRLGERWLNGGCAGVIRRCFHPHPERSGRLVNRRLLEERKECDEWIEKSRKGGRKSAEARVAKRKSGSSSVGPVVGECLKPTSNNSYSQSQKREKKKREPPDGFPKFWNAYPNRQGKGAAEAAWRKLTPDATLLAELLAAIQAQKVWREQGREAGQFRPAWKHPSTWLNQRCWEDEIEAEPTILDRSGPDEDQAREIMEAAGCFCGDENH